MTRTGGPPYLRSECVVYPIHRIPPRNRLKVINQHLLLIRRQPPNLLHRPPHPEPIPLLQRPINPLNQMMRPPIQRPRMRQLSKQHDKIREDRERHGPPLLYTFHILVRQKPYPDKRPLRRSRTPRPLVENQAVAAGQMVDGGDVRFVVRVSRIALVAHVSQAAHGREFGGFVPFPIPFYALRGDVEHCCQGARLRDTG